MSEIIEIINMCKELIILDLHLCLESRPIVLQFLHHQSSTSLIIFSDPSMDSYSHQSHHHRHLFIESPLLPYTVLRFEKILRVEVCQLWVSAFLTIRFTLQALRSI